MEIGIGKVVRQRTSKKRETVFNTGGRLGIVHGRKGNMYLISFKGYKGGHSGNLSKNRVDMIWLFPQHIKLVRSKNK